MCEGGAEDIPAMGFSSSLPEASKRTVKGRKETGNFCSETGNSPSQYGLIGAESVDSI